MSPIPSEVGAFRPSVTERTIRPGYGRGTHGNVTMTAIYVGGTMRRTITAVAALLVTIGLAGCTVPDNTSEASTKQEAGQTKEAGKSGKDAGKKAAPGIGDKVRDGKFEFTVVKITKKASVGNDMVGTKAQGVFVLVHVKVKNIGKKAQLFDSSSQKLFDTDDREFSADGEAGIYLGDSNSFLNEINPGNQVKGIVVFDVPKDATPAKLELHDSPFSGGVKVSLR